MAENMWQAEAIMNAAGDLESVRPKKKDLDDKRRKYAEMGVPEYWLFDPKGDVYPPGIPRLQGLKLVNGEYRPLKVAPRGRQADDPQRRCWAWTCASTASCFASGTSRRAGTSNTAARSRRTRNAPRRPPNAPKRPPSAQAQARQEAAQRKTAEARAQRESARGEQEAAPAEREAAIRSAAEARVAELEAALRLS